MSRQTIAVIMDPLAGIQPRIDTSFSFMLEAAARDVRVLHVNPGHVTLSAGGVTLRGTEVQVFDRDKRETFFSVMGEVLVPARECSAIFIRTDPPFDEHYLAMTWILSFAEEKGVRIINSPKGLRNANEHLYSMYFPELCPETLITSSTTETLEFVDRVGGEAIAKPIDGHGGFGVVRLRQGDSNIRALCDMLSLKEHQPFMVQRFISNASAGDRRLFVVDGVLKGVVCRLAQEGEHRGNVYAGGRVVAGDITHADIHIVDTMRERMLHDGLFFVGLDTIGNRLIEVNVTSPAMVRQLKELTGVDVAAMVMDHALA